jgi:hypothetical protein
MIPVGKWHRAVVLMMIAAGLLSSLGVPEITLAAGYATVILADHPSAYWRLGEASGTTSVADSSGQNHSASVFGPVGLGAGGAILGDSNTAAALNGQTAYLRGASAMTVTGDFTLEAWVKPATTSASGSIVSLSSGNSSRMLYLSGGQILAMADVSGTWPTYTVFGPNLDASWHHVVFATSGGTLLRLYVDGQLAGSTTVATRVGFSANPVIGWSDATWMSKLAGTVDEVALYPTTLSATQAATHFTASGRTLAGASAYASAVAADAPAGYWRLGDSAGSSTLADTSGQNHPATISGKVTLGAPGALAGDANTAATFDGSTGFARTGTPLAVGADFTLEAWVKPSTPSATGSIVSLTSGASSRTLYLNGGQLLGMADLSGSWPSYTIFGPNLDTSWHHVVFSVQGGTALRLYVDGSSAGAATVAARPTFSATAVIAWTDATWMSKFPGSIDEVAVYPTALSAARIATHYSAATGLAPRPNCGTSLQSLVDAAGAGAILSVPACVYRETVTIAKPLTLVGQAGSEIRGSDIWSAWIANGSTWVSQQSVPSLPTVSNDPNACDPGTNNRCQWPEQVYVDGQALSQVAAGTTPGAGQFALVSASDRRVVVGSNPSGHVLEVTTRPRWIVTAADGVTIKNLTMRDAGNSAVAGAISNDHHSNWTLQGSTLSNAHSADVSIESGSNVHVLQNDISLGGLDGIAGDAVTSGGVIRGNHIHHNRTADAAFNRAWGAGGVKVTQVQNLLIDGNEADHNDGPGLWCDVGCTNVTFSNNAVHHNQWMGINFEISNGASIHDNSLWENGWGFQSWGWGAGITASSSANAEIFHNTVAWNYAGISVIWQNRPDSPGPSPVGNYVHDNIIVKKTVVGDFGQTFWDNLSLAWLSDGTAPIFFDPAGNNRGSNNGYWYDLAENLSVRFAWTAQYLNLAQFQATPGGVGGGYISQTTMTQSLTSKAIPTTPEAH